MFLAFLMSNSRTIALVILLGLIASGGIALRGAWHQNSLMKDEISLKTKQISELSAQVIAYDNAKVAAELAIGEAAKKQQQVITVYRDKVVTVRNEEVPKLCDKAIEFATQSSVFAW